MDQHIGRLLLEDEVVTFTQISIVKLSVANSVALIFFQSILNSKKTTDLLQWMNASSII